MLIRLYIAFALNLFIYLFPSVSYSSFLPPGGNNNDVQYKNGLSYAGSNNLMVNGGNVGVMSTAPGQVLDVAGTLRTTYMTVSGQSPISGDVMSATDTSGDATWSTAGGASGWISSGNNVYETNSVGNVGIGTTTPQGSLVVTNGNVGIGTWIPADTFQVGKYKSSSSGFDIDSNGNVGMGTIFTNQSPLSIMNGNVGIGTWVPGIALDVNGSVSVGNVSAGVVTVTGTPGNTSSTAYASIGAVGCGTTNYSCLQVNGASNNMSIVGSGSWLELTAKF